MNSKMMILHLIDGFGNSKKLQIQESSSIPSIGHRINMGYMPCPRVTEVIWNYDKMVDGMTMTEVTVFMNDRPEQ